MCYRAVILGTLPGAARLAQVVAWVMGWGGEDRTTLSGVGAAAGTDGRGRDLAILTSCVAARCKRHTRDVRLGIVFLYVSLQLSHPHVLASRKVGARQEGAKKKIVDRHVQILGLRPKMTTHPPNPKPPFLTPYINKKGVNLLRIQAATCLHSSHAK